MGLASLGIRGPKAGPSDLSVAALGILILIDPRHHPVKRTKLPRGVGPSAT
jgi:hypothetical protein